MALDVQASYATIAEASVYLSEVNSWLSASNQSKQNALMWGRYYIDQNYTSTFDQSAPPTEVKFANALLASDFLTDGDLFYSNDVPVKSKTVKAGSVEVSKTYQAYSKKPTSIGRVDAILSSVATRIGGSGTAFLIRA